MLIHIHESAAPHLVAVPNQPWAAVSVSFDGVLQVWSLPECQLEVGSNRLASPTRTIDLKDLTTFIELHGVASIAASKYLGLVGLGFHDGGLLLDQALRPLCAWTLPDLQRMEAVAFSPAGNLIAIADGNERVRTAQLVFVDARVELGNDQSRNLTHEQHGEPRLVVTKPGDSPEPGAVGEPLVVTEPLRLIEPVGEMIGGEYTGALAFSPDGRILVAGCSYQGGTSVSLADVAADGALVNLRELERSDSDTPDESWCDYLTAVAISPDGRSLALYETVQGNYAAKSIGWRGIVSVYDLSEQTLRWSQTIDATMTQDTRSIDTFDGRGGGGYRADIVFHGNGKLLLNTSAGAVLGFDVDTGAMTNRITLPAPYEVADV